MCGCAGGDHDGWIGGGFESLDAEHDVGVLPAHHIHRPPHSSAPSASCSYRLGSKRLGRVRVEEDQRRRRRNVSPNAVAAAAAGDAVAAAAAGDAVAAAVAAAGDAERVEEELEIIFEKLLCDVSVGAVTGRRNKPPRPKALASRVPKKESRLSTTINLIITITRCKTSKHA